MNIQRVKIIRLSIQDSKKDGSKYLTKKGDPYYRAGIKTDRFGDEWLSGFIFKKDALFEGEELDIIIEENEKDGKIYKNFRIPKKEELLEIRIKKLEDAVFGGQKTQVDQSAKEPEISDDDIPF